MLFELLRPGSLNLMTLRFQSNSLLCRSDFNFSACCTFGIEWNSDSRERFSMFGEKFEQVQENFCGLNRRCCIASAKNCSMDQFLHGKEISPFLRRK